MKLPFLEHTAVGISVKEESVQWVEINRIGKKLSLKSFGEIPVASGEKNLEQAFVDIKEQVQSDAYLTACSFEDLLVQFKAEDVPYFEETAEITQWAQDRSQIISDETEELIRVQYHLVEVDEDHRRCIFQLIDENKLDACNSLLQEADLIPSLISSGIIEAGYSLIYEEDFVEDVSGILIKNGNTGYLSCYKYGLLQNLYEIEAASESHALIEADSYLRSEESSYEKARGNIPLFTTQEIQLENETTQAVVREVRRISPLYSKTNFADLPQGFGTACGLAVKLFFPDLDAFNYSKDEAIEKAQVLSDKKECTRTAVLLLAPLVVMFLLVYAVEGILDYKLLETSQVMNRIGDKIELVNQKNTEVGQANATYKEVKNLLVKRENIAGSFELVNTAIPSKLWLKEIKITNPDKAFTKVVLHGFAPQDAMVADFMGNLETMADVDGVRLTGTEKALKDNIGELDIQAIQLTEFRMELQVVD